MRRLTVLLAILVGAFLSTVVTGDAKPRVHYRCHYVHRRHHKRHRVCVRVKPKKKHHRKPPQATSAGPKPTLPTGTVASPPSIPSGTVSAPPTSTTTTTTSSTTTAPASTTSTTSTTTTTPPPPPPAGVQHVVVIVMENSSPSILSQMPYLNGLATANAQATNYYAIGHYSADNYIALTSGTTCCFDDSFSNLSSTPSIFSQLGSAAQTLAERGGGGYAQRHDPGAYYGFTSLGFTSGQSVDLTGKKFTLVVPGLCDDMHDCSASSGDNWLKANVPSFLSNPGTVVFITFDEGAGGSQGATTPPANQVAMVIAGDGASGTDATQWTHYSLLHTVENFFGLPCLGSACAASAMDGHLGLP